MYGEGNGEEENERKGKKGGERGETKKGIGTEREKKEKNPRVRERSDARERLCRGYMEMLVKYIIPA